MNDGLDALAYHFSYRSEIGSGTHTKGVHNEWSGEVEATPLRGRIDFSAVSGKNVFDAGDYALFDGAGAIIVKPQAKTVTEVGPSPRAAEMAAQYRSVIEDLAWKVDILTDDEVVAGYHTVHCRATATYRTDITVAPDPLERLSEIAPPTTVLIADFWYAKVDGLPANPVVPFASSGVNDAAGVPELASMWASINAQLEPHGKPLRFHTVITVTTGDIENVSRFSGSVSNIRRVRTDPSKLTAPADFFLPESEVAARQRWQSPP